MTINIPCWTTSKEEADKLLDNLSEVCFEYGKDESNPKMLNVFYATKALKNYVGIMQGRIELLNARIAELEEKQRWIPVSERLPEIINHMEFYDAVVEGEEFVEIALWDGWHKTWNLYDGGDSYSCTTFVTHWRERPTLPEVTE